MIELPPPLWLPAKPAIVRAASLKEVEKHANFGLGFISGMLKIPGAQMPYHVVDSSHTANHSWTANLGTAVDSNDFFIVAVSSTNGAVSSASLGGNGMSLIASTGGLNVWQISASGFGATATLSVNYSATNGAAAMVWRVTQANSSPVVNNSNTSGPFSISVLLNYMVLIMTCAVDASAITISISGVGQDFTEGSATPIDIWHAGGHALQSSNGTLSVSISYGGGTASGATFLAFQGHS